MKNVYVGWGPVGLTKIKQGQAKKLQLDKSNYTGTLNSSFKLSINSEYVEVPVWQSSNELVAIVDQEGNVTLVGEGTAVITVTSGELVGKCSIKVTLSNEQQFEKDLETGKVILKDPITKTAVVSNNASIDLNNQSLIGEVFAESNGEMLEGNTDSYAIWAKEGSTITINGNGEVRSQEAIYSMAVWAQGGTVIINDGKYYNAGEGSDLIYASAGGNVYIYGGEFYPNEKQSGVSGTTDRYTALNVKDADYRSGASEIVVYGGKFYGFNPANNTSEGPNTNFVAEGYESIEVEPNVWEVQKIKSMIDEGKIYYGTIQSPNFQSYSELTEAEVNRAIKEGTLKEANVEPNELVVNINNEGDAVVVLIPNSLYKAYKDDGSGSNKIPFNEVNTGTGFHANGETKLGSFYVYGEWMIVTGMLRIYVE